MLGSSSRAVVVFTWAAAVACELPSSPTVPGEMHERCQDNPELTECVEAVTAYCVEHPKDETWCSPDAGSADGSTGEVATDASLGPDGGCTSCPTPECTEGSDCASHPVGSHCSPAQRCVACLEPLHCPATDPVCSDEACQGCTTKADCSGRTETPACDVPSGDCVACTESDAAQCSALHQVCKAGGTECVQCNVDADCQDVTKPICGTDNMCRGCTADLDCQSAGEVCREATGECVACEPNQDDPTLENCANGNACHPTQFTCTGAKRSSLSTCDACVSDSECTAGKRCVLTHFGESGYGQHCLLVAPEPPLLCPNQYAAKRLATSALGVADTYCFPNDTFTTCEAVLDFKNGCVADSDCGATGLDDGLCRADACTYGCDSARDCSGSTDLANKCISGVGAEKYCDPN